MSIENSKKKIYKKKDFYSKETPRWCPGCGDFSILSATTAAFEALGHPRENFLIVSGIGCSSRFPYYCNTYGFHTLHGRATTIALGAKIVNPKLSVWVVTGDGDALSIGGNHFLHIIRRNPNITILLFNNRIYGLTKGQASPTSLLGQKTKSTPTGLIDKPINPLNLAINAGATFVARVIATDTHMLKNILIEADQHRGISIVEIYTNCIIFNNGCFKDYSDKDHRDDNTVKLEHDKPLIFGKDKDKVITFDNFKPQISSLENSSPSNLLNYNVRDKNNSIASVMANMEKPLALGIFRKINSETYDDKIIKQHDDAKQNSKIQNIKELFHD